MKIWSILSLAFVVAVSGCSKSSTNPSNQNQIVVRKANILIGKQNAVQTLIYTPYLREGIWRSADGTLNLRVLTATILDNDDEQISQSILFEGIIIREVWMVTYNKRTKTTNEAKYSPDGTFIMQRTNANEWSDQNGKPLSLEQQINNLKQALGKSIDLNKIEIQPK